MVDSASGRITGSLKTKGEYPVVLCAKNPLGRIQRTSELLLVKKLLLLRQWAGIVGTAGLVRVDAQKVLRSARAMASSGLINHGWTYINIDDTWQGKRTGKDHALQGNEKFPDMAQLCDELHKLGLKAGIYSTPWITSYGKHPGGSSDNADGSWNQAQATKAEQRHGQYSFALWDAKQWADWGFDYLKYDWRPNDVPHVSEMSKALRQSGRDIVFSLSNTADFDHAADWARSGRTVGARPATSRIIGPSVMSRGNTPSRKSAFPRNAGHLMPSRAIGMIRICSWWDMSVGGRNSMPPT